MDLRNGCITLLLAWAGCGRIAFVPVDSSNDAVLAITPEVARLNLGSRLTFVATGGEPPYVFARTSGTGKLDPDTGAFRAPGYPGAATVEVRDAAGAIATAQLGFGGDALYAVGGFVDGFAVDSVWRSTDGVAWDVIGQLPAARGGGELVVFDDHLIYLGGSSEPEGTRFREVWSSPDGIAWTELATLPAPMMAAAGIVMGDQIWLLGGRTPGEDYELRVWSSGDAIDWRAEAPLRAGVHGARAAVVGNELWLVAGHVNPEVTDRIWGRSSGDGIWSEHGAVPAPGEFHGATVHAGELWVAGGQGLRDRVVSSVDGMNWNEHARLPLAREQLHLLEWQQALWVAGGAPAQVWRSISGGPWSVTGTFPAFVEGATFAQLTPRS
jgi:hypothetical protein